MDEGPAQEVRERAVERGRRGAGHRVSASALVTSVASDSGRELRGAEGRVSPVPGRLYIDLQQLKGDAAGAPRVRKRTSTLPCVPRYSRGDFLMRAP